MKNIYKIMMIIVIVAIGTTIGIKNLKDINKGYVVSDIEIKDKVEKEDIKGEDNYKQDSIQVNKTSTSTKEKITIYISGEVKEPGVVELDSDDRLEKGVSLCGGLTEDANLNGINLAMKIQDEGHYIIPKIGDEIINNNIEKNIDDNSSESLDKGIADIQDENKININKATLSELDSLPGFGEVTSQKIIDYREENTKFNSIEEIKNIKGIGDKKFNDVKDYICVQ